jgi:predicted O-methyltransferase YrrM
MNHKQVTGYVTDDDLEVLKFGIKWTPNGGTIIEVGIMHGYCTAFLIEEIANSEKNIRLVACDIFEDEDNYQRVLTFLKDYPVEIMKCRSLDLDIERADFVWLDGDHTYENVKAELNKFYGIVPDDGIIAGHDYLHPSYPEVRQAVDEFAKEHHIEIITYGYSFYFIK